MNNTQPHEVDEMITVTLYTENKDNASNDSISNVSFSSQEDFDRFIQVNELIDDPDNPSRMVKTEEGHTQWYLEVEED